MNIVKLFNCIKFCMAFLLRPLIHCSHKVSKLCDIYAADIIYNNGGSSKCTHMFGRIFTYNIYIYIHYSRNASYHLRHLTTLKAKW